MKLVALTLAVSSFVSASAFAASSAGKANKAAVHAKQEALAPEISLDELHTMLSQKMLRPMVIIDANSEKSYSDGHIPGAIHYAKVQSNLAAALPADKNDLVIAYCGSPMCTAWQEPATKAKALGYTNIRHLKAGIKGWNDAKYTTEGSGKKS